MGARQFRRAYDYLKSVQDADDDALDYDVDDAGLEIGGDAYDEQADAETQRKLLAILGPDKVHLAPLVDQLLFMEEGFGAARRSPLDSSSVREDRRRVVLLVVSLHPRDFARVLARLGLDVGPRELLHRRLLVEEFPDRGRVHAVARL